QKFDGKTFTTIPRQPGLPDDKLAIFFRCLNGDLLISHREGISRYEIAANKFVEIYRNKQEKQPVLFIGEDENIIYFYTADGNITGISSQYYNIISNAKTDFISAGTDIDYRPRFSSNIIHHKVVFQVDTTLFLWDLKKSQLLYRSGIQTALSGFILTMKTENEVLYADYKISRGLGVYDFRSGKTSELLIQNKDESYISRCIIYPWQKELLVSFNSRLFETDKELRVLKSEWVNFQNDPVGGSSGISRMAKDNFGNIYVTTIMNGIRKIIRNNYPIKYFGTENKENVLSIFPDKAHNRIFTGTSGNGLLVFDTMQRLVKHIKTLPGTSVPFAVNAIVKTRQGFLIFVVGAKSLWLLNNDLSKMTSLPVLTTSLADKAGLDYFGNFLFQNDQQVVIQSQGKIFETSLPFKSVTQHKVTNFYTMSGVLHNGRIVTHANDELIFVDTATFKVQQRLAFTNTGYVRCFAKDSLQNLYIGSNNGIFKIDSQGRIIEHLKKQNGLPDDCIYAMVFDNKGFLWCSTNKGIFRLNKDNSVFQLTKEDGLQENEFNTNAVAKAEDGEVFFGGVNGVSSFYPEAIKSFNEKISILVTRIKVNNADAFADTAVCNIEKINLPYSENLLAFDFIAMGDNNPGQYVYQYKMKGIDKEWIQNNDLQTVRYFLPPGKYIFQVTASRFFDKNAVPLKEIRIIIHPPFWRTWWFFISIGLFMILVTAYLINQYNAQNYKRKLADFETDQKVRMERERISRDLHDSIGAYANAVLYNTELLEKEPAASLRKNLMKDLKFASKDIITSLRETIWALKQDNYTTHDCMIRIRNFIQPLSRYYPHINFKIEGEASQSSLHYTKALNAVRIVQEAVTNAIKHSQAKNIFVKSHEDENEWRLEITDDGLGFDETITPNDDRGNGLENMKQRAAEASFNLKITSAPGVGTSIVIKV
ncbi:MAG: hypothetical protein H7X88_13165, partial [Gloeobacteraceae cyanobacterium ES-bin-316]|nr:hypothetical protein [Ferruginibacter sp.]